MTRSSRLSRAAILTELKLAARKGDRVALTLAIEHMKLWALSPRYWEKYLDLLSHWDASNRVLGRARRRMTRESGDRTSRGETSR